MPQFVRYYNCALRILFCVFQYLAIVNGLPLMDLQFKDSPSGSPFNEPIMDQNVIFLFILETNSAPVATKSHGDLMFEYWVPSERPETKGYMLVCADVLNLLLISTYSICLCYTDGPGKWNYRGNI